MTLVSATATANMAIIGRTSDACVRAAFPMS
jgi:hypothetical protein